MNKINKRSIGREGEKKAISFLQEKGYYIIETNYMCKTGEIDIIAKDDNTIVFVEVKYRKNDRKGRPYEAVNYYKQRHIIRTAMIYASQKNIYDKPLRFDIVEIIGDNIKIYKNAFQIENLNNYL